VGHETKNGGKKSEQTKPENVRGRHGTDSRTVKTPDVRECKGVE
jgi:hypothetical protein